MADILSYSIRVLLVFVFTYFGARILSKKAIAEMTAYEMAGIILLSTVAAEPLVTKLLIKSIYGTGLLVLLIFIVSKLTLNPKLSMVLEHTPTIIIKNGKLKMKGLKASTLSLNQLLGQIRAKGYDKISDIEFALLEPQGTVSVFPKSQVRPVQPKDLKISTQYEGLTLPLIMDGLIIDANLSHAKLTKDWLLNAIKAQGITNYRKEVALAELDTSGNLIISKK